MNRGVTPSLSPTLPKTVEWRPANFYCSALNSYLTEVRVSLYVCGDGWCGVGRRDYREKEMKKRILKSVYKVLGKFPSGQCVKST